MQATTTTSSSSRSKHLRPAATTKVTSYYESDSDSNNADSDYEEDSEEDYDSDCDCDYDSEYDSDHDQQYENPSMIGKENETANSTRAPTLASSSAENTSPTKPRPARATATDSADDDDDEDRKPAARSKANGRKATKIQWEDKTFLVHEPDWLDLDVCIENFVAKSKIDEMIASAETKEERDSLVKFKTFMIETFFPEEYKKHNGPWRWNLRSLVGNTPGVYYGIFESAEDVVDAHLPEFADYLEATDLDDETTLAEDTDDADVLEAMDLDDEETVVEDTNGARGKIGMSFTCRDRVNRQGFKCAARVMSLGDMRRLVSDDYVRFIKELRLPGIIFHNDQQEKEENIIRMHLSETFFACAYDCRRGIVAERFTQLPNRRVREATAVHKFDDDDDAVKSMRDIPDGGVSCLFSWATLQSMKPRYIELQSERDNTDCFTSVVFDIFWYVLRRQNNFQ